LNCASGDWSNLFTLNFELNYEGMVELYVLANQLTKATFYQYLQ